LRSGFGVAPFVDQALNFLGFDQHPAPDPNGANLTLPQIGPDGPRTYSPDFSSFLD
jgi:hypothetical protein